MGRNVSSMRPHVYLVEVCVRIYTSGPLLLHTESVRCGFSHLINFDPCVDLLFMSQHSSDFSGGM